MSLSKESPLIVVLNLLRRIVAVLPYGAIKGLGFMLGRLGYWCLPKKREVVRANLRRVLKGEGGLARLNACTKDVFVHLAMLALEVLMIPRIVKQGVAHWVDVKGKDIVEQELQKGKGVIFLAIHGGNWEIASLVGSVLGYPYNIVANEQTKTPRLNAILNELRSHGGGKVINPGSATKDILRALFRNEIVSLVFDQGGAQGMNVEFFGKNASMSTGAIRLAIKYKAALCPVWITRLPDGRHALQAFEPLALPHEDDDQGVATVVAQAAAIFEKLISQTPHQYLWFYKVWKYSNQSDILILDDTRTGHLRQSQAVADALGHVLKHQSHLTPRVTTLQVLFQSKFKQKAFQGIVFLSRWIKAFRCERVLQWALVPTSYQALLQQAPDYIISCGSKNAAVNFVLSQACRARSVSVLKGGVVNPKDFYANITPSHDGRKLTSKAFYIQTKAAPNLITPAYLKENAQRLVSRFTHLSNSVRPKFGVLIGGDTKGVVFTEETARVLMRQLNSAAEHFNADIILTTSRRTPSDVDALISREAKNSPRITLAIIANNQNIPEAVGGILGLNDIVIVSGESISMVSEAMSSGKPVIVFSANGTYSSQSDTKYDRFVMQLNKEGYLLACDVNNVSMCVGQVMSQKIRLKSIDDRQQLIKGFEQRLS